MKTRSVLLTLALCVVPFASFAEDLPAPADLVSKYYKAVGGKEAMLKVKSRIDHGKLVLPDMGMEAVYVAYTQPPNSLNTSDFNGMGVVKNGQTDGFSWTINPFQGNSKQPAPRPAEIFPFANLDLLSAGAKTLGQEDLGGKPAYKAEFPIPNGKPITVFFDKESGFIVANETQNDDGSVGRVLFSDYKKVGDLTIPHVTRIEGALTLEITADTVELNAEVPAGTFDMPEEIKALP